MKTKNINLKIGKKIKEIELEVVPWYLEWLGLMFSRSENAKALLFDFKKPVNVAIHSFFVNYEFIAIWIDSFGKIVEIRKVKPWSFRILPSRSFSKLIEIPCNSKYSDICSDLVEDKTFKY